MSAVPPFIRWFVWAGNNPLFTFTLNDSLGVPLDLTGYSIRLRVVWPGGQFALTSGDAGFSIEVQSGATMGQFSIRFPLAQTRLFPTTSPAAFEIETRQGVEEITVIYGEIVSLGGINTDG